MHPFSTPRNHQKTLSFLVFSGGCERVQRKWVKSAFTALSNIMMELNCEKCIPSIRLKLKKNINKGI